MRSSTGSRLRRTALASSATLSALAILLLPALADAAPTVHLRVEPVPIPGFPHTGYILGHGAALQAEYRIEGTEYGGFPPPLIGVTFNLPVGTKLHPQGFPTCTEADLQRLGPGRGCPRGSSAGPVGHALGVVAFGKEIVPEETTIEPFYAPGGGLLFFTAGHDPVSLEIISGGHYEKVSGGTFSQRLVSQIPLVETVPGAQDASVERISVKVGTAMMSKGRPVYYGTLPSTCPREGFTVLSDLVFAGLGGLPQQTVTVDYKAPCPRR